MPDPQDQQDQNIVKAAQPVQPEQTPWYGSTVQQYIVDPAKQALNYVENSPHGTKNFRQGLENMADDLGDYSRAARERGIPAPILDAAALGLKSVPVGSTVKDTAAMIGMGAGKPIGEGGGEVFDITREAEQASEPKLLPRYAEDATMRKIQPITIHREPGVEQGSRVTRAEQGGKTISSVDLTSGKEPGVPQIGMAYTVPEYEGKGLGKITTNALLQDAASRGIDRVATGPVLSSRGQGLVESISREHPFTPEGGEGSISPAGVWDLTQSPAYQPRISPYEGTHIRPDANTLPTGVHPIAELPHADWRTISEDINKPISPLTRVQLPEGGLNTKAAPLIADAIQEQEIQRGNIVAANRGQSAPAPKAKPYELTNAPKNKYGQVINPKSLKEAKEAWKKKK